MEKYEVAGIIEEGIAPRPVKDFDEEELYLWQNSNDYNDVMAGLQKIRIRKMAEEIVGLHDEELAEAEARLEEVKGVLRRIWSSIGVYRESSNVYMEMEQIALKLESALGIGEDFRKEVWEGLK